MLVCACCLCMQFGLLSILLTYDRSEAKAKRVPYKPLFRFSDFIRNWLVMILPPKALWMSEWQIGTKALVKYIIGYPYSGTSLLSWCNIMRPSIPHSILFLLSFCCQRQAENIENMWSTLAAYISWCDAFVNDLRYIISRKSCVIVDSFNGGAYRPVRFF
jgi:hypothetical protein